MFICCFCPSLAPLIAFPKSKFLKIYGFWSISTYEGRSSRCWRCVIYLSKFFLRFPFQGLKHSKHVQSEFTKFHLITLWAHQDHLLQRQWHDRRLFHRRSDQRIESEIHINEYSLLISDLLNNSPMWKDNTVGIRIQYIDHCISLNETLDFAQDQGPFQLIIGLVSGGIFINMFGQFSDQITDQLHFLEQKAHHNKSGIEPKFLDHQIRPEIQQAAKEIRWMKTWIWGTKVGKIVRKEPHSDLHMEWMVRNGWSVM